MTDRPARASKLRSRAAWATLIFAAALGLRVGFILETQDRPGFRTPMPGMDTHVHWQAARALRGGATTDEPVFELMLPSAPLYVHWLAFWQRLLGDASITPHRVQHALLGSLNAVLVYLLVGSLLGPGARGREPIAVVVATIWAGLPSLIFFDTSLHKSALGLFLVLVLLLTLLRSRPRRSRLGLAAEGSFLGGLLGLLFLCQQSTFLFVAAVLLFVLLERGVAGGTWAAAGEKAWKVVPLVLVLSGIVAGFQLRTSIWDQTWPWYLPQAGIHLRVGHQYDATGGYDRFRDIPDYPYGHVFHARLYAETRLEQRQSPWQADRRLTEEAIRFVRLQPRRALGLWTTKALRFFNDFEQKGVQSLHRIESYSRILRVDPLGLGVFVVLSGLGVLHLLVRRRPRLLVLLLGLLGAILVANLMTFVTWRYRLLGVAPLAGLAALGLALLWDEGRKIADAGLAAASRPLLAAMLAVVVACGWLAYQPQFREVGERQAQVATRHERASARAEESLAALEKLAGAPRSRAVALRRANLLFELHEFTEAFAIYTRREACRPPVGEGVACARYARLLLWLGRYDEITRLLGPLREREPDAYERVAARFEKLEGRVFDRFIRPRSES